MTDQTRPTTTEDEIDRTGREQEVTGQTPVTGGEDATPFGTPGTPAEKVPEGLENGFA